MKMKSERFKQLFVTIGWGCLAGILLLSIESLYKGISWSNIGWYFLIGCSMMLAGTIAESVWHSLFASMIHKPWSLFVVVSKVPFWFMAGGIGYVVGMLALKKLSLFSVNEIPIQAFFDTGGKAFCIAQFFLLWYSYRRIKQQEKSSRKEMVY